MVGVDAARGLALIGLMSVHVLPYADDETLEPTWSYILFYGDSAALFALLAGVGLALASGGTRPHGGRELTADRVALVVRAVLIAVLGLAIGSLMSDALPVDNILIYYGVFFLLAAPFLHVGPRMLFGSAAVFLVMAPVLMQLLGDDLPGFVAGNPTFGDLLTQPVATTTQLLLTGTYPALAYLSYLLVGLGLGRVDLRSRTIQVRLLAAGVAMAACARGVSSVLLYVAGGYEQLLEASSMDEQDVAEVLIWSESLPTDTWWWLAIASPHTNTPLALAASLGTGLAVLGFFLLISRALGAWLLPLSAMGSMTLSLYTAHLVALSFEVHYDRPYLWFTIQLITAVLFAVAWQRALGQGPLERVVGAVAKGARRRSLAASAGADPG
ncbi:heparan-alpha-glucosaminide N-acetyltransferase domain-containing protein [uncultured Kocuria sp.]|uniref:heparan-alpha-glucosaminide N-acetyltransferase domain-containing protein n=1 Tax=uncultured Kocuria sp. TaxID=259305 RepID=UPI00260BAA4B|nr:heparan-alpha-glucosaminide N-acetyltransferase domain-containing protein [uncultured Kocuria sp.]